MPTFLAVVVNLEFKLGKLLLQFKNEEQISAEVICGRTTAYLTWYEQFPYDTF